MFCGTIERDMYRYSKEEWQEFYMKNRKSFYRWKKHMLTVMAGVMLFSGSTCLAQEETDEEDLLQPSTITYQDGVTHHLEEPSTSVETTYELNMDTLLQNPELPTGCESVALTMVLNYWGYPIAKTRLVDEYLVYNEDNFAAGYVGDPYSDEGAGVFSPGLTKTANAYLEDQSSELEARNISGCEFSKLYDYVEAGYPVIVWTTMYMSEPVATDNFCEYEGHEYQWFSNEHCVVFMGFHKDTNEVVINDPLEGIVYRDATDFEEIFDRMGKQAVIIREQ